MKTNYYSRICKMLLLVLTGVPFFTLAQQTSCPNSDFSSVTFTNWKAQTSVYPYNTPGTNIGTPQAPYPSPPYYYKDGVVDGRHTIFTRDTLDPLTCNNLSILPPGENYSVRLGNGGIGTWGDGVRWQRDYLSYTFQITPSNALLVYKYAVVLQDPAPHHSKEIRPRFKVSILDQNGKSIDPVCGIHEDFADSTIAGYQNCKQLDAEKLGAKLESEGDIVYKLWTTVGVDLRKFIGTNITIGFETWDCGLGGHFGYAYLTTKCTNLTISASSCAPGGPVTLTAPIGFKYKWLPSGDTTQSIVINNAHYGDSAVVELTSLFGCKSILKTKLFSNQAVANFNSDSSTCVGTPVYFTDKSVENVVSWKWDFGDGSTSDSQNPSHIYTTTGTYQVKLKIRNSHACVDSVVKSIYVCPDASVHDLNKSLTMRAFPNPSTGTYKLEIGQINIGNVQVIIKNILGQVVLSEENSLRNGILQKEIDIHTQPDGIYFLTLKSEEYNGVVRLIKKN
jgi:PKD repeat protein